jgi:hypothetical protein
LSMSLEYHSQPSNVTRKGPSPQANAL